MLFLFLFLSSPLGVHGITSSCLSALEALFSSTVSNQEAGEFLQIQGNITLHRMAWAYLKAQKYDNTRELENVERTILTLLDEKYTSSDEKFIKAREVFENQPLSRTTLSDLAPYLKDVLSAEFSSSEQSFILNASDLKLLHTLAKFERASPKQDKYESRMLAKKSPEGMLNFMKLINASYKTSTSNEEKDLDVEVKLRGLESVLRSMQKKLMTFLNKLEVPSQCKDVELCTDSDLGKIFNDNQIVQEIFWKSLEQKLITDDILFDHLTFGEIWLKVKNSDLPPAQTTLEKSIRKTTIGKVTKSSPKSAFGSFYVSKTGLLIQDPVAIIVKDGQNRKVENWVGFDEAYLKSMADAILQDDKVFLVAGKIYDRKTGKKISHEKALEFLPPQAREDFKKTILNKDPMFVVKQISAKVNGDKTFIHNDFLYDLEARKLSPESAIALQMTKKTGNFRLPSNYQGMERGYLLDRANALMNNKPHFVVKSEVFDTETGRQISSPFRSSYKLQNVKISKERRVEYQNLSDQETIVNFNRDRADKTGCQYYAIVDKKKAEMTVHHLNGTTISTFEVLVGINSSDKLTYWTKPNERDLFASGTTGAGIYKIGISKTNDDIQKKYSNNLMQIQDQKVFAIHQVPNYMLARYSKFGTGNPQDRRVSGGCVNLKKSDYLNLQKWITPSCQVYVLPEESQNKFIVKDGELKFLPTSYVTKSDRYNFSKSKTEYQPIDIKITNDKGKTKHSVEFIQTLEQEKKKLMRLFNISNDDYNDLAALSYAIMGNESDFGRSTKYWIKEYDQGDVIAAKFIERAWKGKNPFDKSVLNTSRGFTQIKNLPEGEWKKEYPQINKETLRHPKNSAVATMAYLIDAVGTLKKIAHENSKDPKKVRITRENLVDYLGYIYQGRKGSLKSSRDPANADFNTYIQSLRKNMSYIEIAQKIE
jgi:hypothetical protein